MKLSLATILAPVVFSKAIIENRNRFDEINDSPTSMALYRRNNLVKNEIEPMDGDDLPEVQAFGYNANLMTDDNLFGLDLGLNIDLGLNYELPLYNQDQYLVWR